MKNETTTATETKTYILQDGRWYPTSGTTVDQRDGGYASKAAVRREEKQRRHYTGQKTVVRFQ